MAGPVVGRMVGPVVGANVKAPPPPPPPNLWRALEHPEHRRLRAYGEEHEDGEHGARGDVVAIEEA